MGERTGRRPSVKDPCKSVHRSRILVVQEQKSEVRFENPSKQVLERIKVDGCAITDDGPRCDFLVNIPSRKISYFIELKGSDVTHAYAQLERSHRLLSARCSGSVHWLVSANRVPKLGTKLQQMKVRAKRDHRATLRVEGSPILVEV